MTIRPEHTKRSEAAAVIVTYRSEASLAAALHSLSEQVGQIIIVRNGPVDSAFTMNESNERELPPVSILVNEKNLGIAEALNQGFEQARIQGYSYALALDQDSIPAKDLVRDLSGIYADFIEDDSIAIAAPNVMEYQSKAVSRYLVQRRGPTFARKYCEDGKVIQATIVISSGGLYDLAVHEELGGFRGNYFIDYVDTEYCLRARQAGYDIVVACDAKLYHRWGSSRQVNFLGITTHPTFHSPLRWYYISRNRIPTIRGYGLRFPHWLLFDLTMAAWWFVRMLVFEDERLRKVKAFVLGTWDGILGRMGPCQREI